MKFTNNVVELDLNDFVKITNMCFLCNYYTINKQIMQKTKFYWLQLFNYIKTEYNFLNIDNFGSYYVSTDEIELKIPFVFNVNNYVLYIQNEYFEKTYNIHNMYSNINTYNIISIIKFNNEIIELYIGQNYINTFDNITIFNSFFYDGTHKVINISNDKIYIKHEYFNDFDNLNLLKPYVLHSDNPMIDKIKIWMPDELKTIFEYTDNMCNYVHNDNLFNIIDGFILFWHCIKPYKNNINNSVYNNNIIGNIWWCNGIGNYDM